MNSNQFFQLQSHLLEMCDRLGITMQIGKNAIEQWEQNDENPFKFENEDEHVFFENWVFQFQNALEEIDDKCENVDQRLLLKLGVFFTFQREFDLAESFFNIVIECGNEVFLQEVAYYNLAIIAKLLGNYDDAINYLQKTCELRPEIAKNWQNLAELALEGNNFAVAERALVRANEIVGKDPKILMFLGRLYEKKGDYSNAIKHYKLAHELDKSDLEIVIRLATILVNKKKYKEVVSLLEPYRGRNEKIDQLYEHAQNNTSLKEKLKNKLFKRSDR